ncbi:CRISPR-associated endoribonuclease Cas6 [Paenibacillus sp. 481]|uniref:CRISPR-associated endoribonuclease Cas6 n=1 Tax=Paenibacillus sp. 481 TaxID=2835869 RepID=UPI001E51E571|nr:CRISPR-associated endoribonuclease Cas6 [Paenibacillus sp. 481]UHA72658.1 CRISPR-associated endoribonuclease Cas6 [Paenibacillus sp. 481]
MRLNVSFQVERLPISYRMLVVSIIKEAIRKMDEAYYHELYSSQRNQPKPFGFAVYLQNYHLMEDEIELERMQVTITSGDYKFMLLVMGGLQQMKHFQYKQYRLKKLNIKMLPDIKITSSRIIVRTLSALHIENKEKKPLAPWDEEYNEHFNYVTNRILNSLSGRGLYEPINVTPIKMSKIIVKESNDEFLQHADRQRSYLYFTAYQGKMLLEGHPADLQWLLDYSAGLRRSQGMGCLALEGEVI